MMRRVRARALVLMAAFVVVAACSVLRVAMLTVKLEAIDEVSKGIYGWSRRGVRLLSLRTILPNQPQT